MHGNVMMTNPTKSKNCTPHLQPWHKRHTRIHRHLSEIRHRKIPLRSVTIPNLDLPFPSLRHIANLALVTQQQTDGLITLQTFTRKDEQKQRISIAVELVDLSCASVVDLLQRYPIN